MIKYVQAEKPFMFVLRFRSFMADARARRRGWVRSAPGGPINWTQAMRSPYSWLEEADLSKQH